MTKPRKKVPRKKRAKRHDPASFEQVFNFNLPTVLNVRLRGAQLLKKHPELAAGRRFEPPRYEAVRLNPRQTTELMLAAADLYHACQEASLVLGGSHADVSERLRAALTKAYRGEK